jgi:hypothetical protein
MDRSTYGTRFTLSMDPRATQALTNILNTIIHKNSSPLLITLCSAINQVNPMWTSITLYPLGKYQWYTFSQFFRCKLFTHTTKFRLFNFSFTWRLWLRIIYIDMRCTWLRWIIYIFTLLSLNFFRFWTFVLCFFCLHVLQISLHFYP